ncbi:MAG: metalloregulator ArsR/SmtB family transcription factor [Gammaproteobacteria bacterium]|nr:winged helix-turn-helix transcriptional regulator [Pseudomonadales bacterium]MCP5347853.1 winged helix-turn-helix transcriptional regulator [Pseudomonadales bacterium]
MIKKQDIESLSQAADLLKLLSNPKRLAILCHLREGELKVSDLAGQVDLSQSALSQHLARLRELDLVKTRRDQQAIYYSINSPEAEAVIEVLHDLYCD